MVLTILRAGSKEDTDVKNTLSDSVGEGKDGII